MARRGGPPAQGQRGGSEPKTDSEAQARAARLCCVPASSQGVEDRGRARLPRQSCLGGQGRRNVGRLWIALHALHVLWGQWATRARPAGGQAAGAAGRLAGGGPGPERGREKPEGARPQAGEPSGPCKRRGEEGARDGCVGAEGHGGAEALAILGGVWFRAKSLLAAWALPTGVSVAVWSPFPRTECGLDALGGGIHGGWQWGVEASVRSWPRAEPKSEPLGAT